MKCHYEILEVSRDAGLPEIKSAYRKFALKWHPDKNLNNTEFAREQFQLVQQAYEVLSDAQERTWYDKHREQILHGSDPDFQDNTLDLYQYFTSTCFRGYGDDSSGFYTVYRNVFDRIVEEDAKFIDDKEEFCAVPRFGESTSDYDRVVGPFYSYWSCYCTKKSYVWLDPYDIKEIRNRRVLKEVEKESKKVRQKARRERNEEVRNLVAFVKKRDRRVQAHGKFLEARNLEIRQKQEEKMKRERFARRKLLDESGGQAEWARFENVESGLEEIEKHLAEQFGDEQSNSEDEHGEFNELYCVACNKIFKTRKALENHESSKKHRDNLERLKESMWDQEQAADSENCSSPIGSEGVDSNIETDGLLQKSKKQKKKKKNRIKKTVLSVGYEDDTSVVQAYVAKVDDSDDDFSFTSTKKQKKKNAKNKSKNTEVMKEEVVSIIEKVTKKQKRQNRNEEIDMNHCCVTCKSNFSSKNKLFRHLKQTGHTSCIPNTNSTKQVNQRTMD